MSSSDNVATPDPVKDPGTPDREKRFKELVRQREEEVPPEVAIISKIEEIEHARPSSTAPTETLPEKNKNILLILYVVFIILVLLSLGVGAYIGYGILFPPA